jgi:hypothetical protein
MAEKSKDKVEYTTSKPTSQLDLEARLERDNENPEVHVSVPVNPSYEAEGEYVGTDPIYQNYANETEKPLAGEGPEQKVVDELKKAHESKDESDEEKSPARQYADEQAKSDAQGPFASDQK